jgi:hypothetical protein
MINVACQIKRVWKKLKLSVKRKLKRLEKAQRRELEI